MLITILCTAAWLAGVVLFLRADNRRDEHHAEFLDEMTALVERIEAAAETPAAEGVAVEGDELCGCSPCVQTRTVAELREQPQWMPVPVVLGTKVPPMPGFAVRWGFA